nr:hypothetical protein CFP56_66252 [Quercus suber]
MECEFSQTKKSKEEEAELHWSNKKVKDAKGASEFGSPPSYRDKLVGEMPGAFAQAFNLDSHEMDLSIPLVEMGELINGMVAVNLTPNTRKSIRSRQNHALIVKVFGQIVGFHYLHSKVLSLWKLAGRLDCVDLGRDFFLMRFGLVEDYENVIKGGVVQEVLYEGISTLCFSCGWVGHRREVCPFTVQEKTPAAVVEENIASANQVEPCGEAGDFSKEAGKVDSEVKGDG